MTATINGRLIRTLRIARGIGTREASRIASVTPVVLHRIEEGNQSVEASITVHGLFRLAEELGTTPQELISDNTNTPPQPKLTSPSQDARVLAGLLLRIGFQANLPDVAKALNWTGERLIQARDHLSRTLTHSGLVLSQRRYTLQLLPDNPAAVDEAFTRYVSNGFDEEGMDITTARVLANIMNGRYDRGGRASLHTLTRLVILEKLGALASRDGRYTPSAALRFALDRD